MPAVLVVAAALVLGCFAFFAAAAASEPVFVDETAYVTQSYFWDLLRTGRRDDWAWVEYHAYDLPPLPKYLIGIAVDAAGYRPPDRLTAGRWFRDITQPLVPESMIHAARWPTLILGALGCLAVYFLGVVLGDWRLGLVAAVLLALNPLYGLLSRRAMADIPAECFTLSALALALWGWKRRLDGRPGWGLSAVTWCASGLLVGLAAAAKLSGLLSAIVIASWMLLATALHGFPLVRKIRIVIGVAFAAVCALTTFVALNPMVTARPKGAPPAQLLAPLPPDQSRLDRLKTMIVHRVEVSARAREQFPHNAVATPLEKLSAVAIQGFGRFGAFGPRDHDSTVAYPRFALDRDWGSAVWLPVVLLGGWLVARRGLAQIRAQEPPTFLALALQAALTLGVVTAFLPLAWDRYYLSIQPVACLLAAAALVAGYDAATRRASPRAQAPS
jgi:4-amino-4-deoxy-L-arabinose transferase-like glycosyltransferase